MRAFLKSRLREQKDLDLAVAKLEVEQAYVEEALRRYDGNITHAANALGIGRAQLYRIVNRRRKKDRLFPATRSKKTRR